MAQGPTLEEVRQYAGRRHSMVDPEEFWIRYQNNGWTIGGKPIRNWQAIFDRWEAREPKPAPQPEPVRQPDPEPEEDLTPEERQALIDDIHRMQAQIQAEIDAYRPTLLRQAGLRND